MHDGASLTSANIRHVFIDLDGTLYPITKDNDYEHHVRDNVFKFMRDRLGVPENDAPLIWKTAFSRYNQSLKGLKMSGYEFDEAEYWDFIRQGAEDFLKPDPEVRRCLLSMPQPKWLFTNANEKSARECLRLLDLEGVFEGIVGADSMGGSCKPEAAAFEAALRAAGAVASQSAMLEDSLKNLRTAKALGMVTVLIAGETAAEERVTREMLAETVDAVVSAPVEAELRPLLPQLFTRQQ